MSDKAVDFSKWPQLHCPQWSSMRVPERTVRPHGAHHALRQMCQVPVYCTTFSGREARRKNGHFRIYKVPCCPILDPNIVDSTETQQLATHW